MYETFTDRARKVIQLANQEATLLNHDHLGSHHILAGLAREGCGVGSHALRELNVSHEKIRELIRKHDPPRAKMASIGKRQPSDTSRMVVSQAIKESQKMGNNFVGTEHLLLALARMDGGIGYDIMQELGLTEEVIRDLVESMVGVRQTSEEPKPGVQIVADLVPFDNAINTMASSIGVDPEPRSEPHSVKIVYRNHRGEVAIRTILPTRFYFGEVEWHPGPQWLVEAFDYEKMAERTFALKDVLAWDVNSPRGELVQGPEKST